MEDDTKREMNWKMKVEMDQEKTQKIEEDMNQEMAQEIEKVMNQEKASIKENTNKKKALIAMSGGIDSSVAVCLMKNAGYDCMGITMKLYDNQDVRDDATKTCCSISDVADARAVAQSFDIPYYVLNFSEDFDKEVIQRFVHTYMVGGTPNPCIECNRYMKFAKLMHRMYELGYDYVVTGHYARVEKDEMTGRFLLKKGLDESKDQSYVLYNLTQEQLAHTLFPLGNYHKTEIRQMAQDMHFVNANKPDSQDICFVPDGDYASFIERYCEKEFPHGEFVNKEGEVLGEHKGLIRYTTGQRKGLGLSLKEPMYVLKKDMEKNQVILGKNEDLFTTTLEANDINWISIEKLTEPMQCKAKTRYKQKEADALLEPLEDGKVRLTFFEPQRAITPGQAVVFYDKDVVIGGGKIL